jgi:hypothetical protein
MHYSHETQLPTKTKHINKQTHKQTDKQTNNNMRTNNTRRRLARASGVTELTVLIVAKRVHIRLAIADRMRRRTRH